MSTTLITAGNLKNKIQAVTETTECRQTNKSVTTSSKATLSTCSDNGGNIHTLKININSTRSQQPKKPAFSIPSQVQLVYHLPTQNQSFIHHPGLCNTPRPNGGRTEVGILQVFLRTMEMDNGGKRLM